MFRLTGSTTLPCDAATASAFLADPANEAAWQTGIVHVELVEGTAGTPGAVHERVQDVGGRKIKTRSELAAHEPGVLVEIHAKGKVIQYTLTYALAAAEGETKVEMRIEGEMLGFASMFEGMATEALEKEIPSNLERLREAVA